MFFQSAVYIPIEELVPLRREGKGDVRDHIFQTECTKTKLLKFHYYAPPGLRLCGVVVYPGLKPGVTDIMLLRS
jgi:hypothetical protein